MTREGFKTTLTKYSKIMNLVWKRKILEVLFQSENQGWWVGIASQIYKAIITLSIEIFQDRKFQIWVRCRRTRGSILSQILITDELKQTNQIKFLEVEISNLTQIAASLHYPEVQIQIKYLVLAQAHLITHQAWFLPSAITVFLLNPVRKGTTNQMRLITWI